MQRLLLLILLIAPKICLAQETTLAQSVQRSIEAAQFHKNLIIIFIVLVIISNLLIIISNILSQSEPEIGLIEAIRSIIPSTGKTKFTIYNTNHQPVAFAKISILDRKDDLLSTKRTGLNGRVNLEIPKNASAIIQSFGYAKRIVNPTDIDKDNFIILKSQDDVSVSSNYIPGYSGIALLVISIFIGIYLGTVITNFYSFAISLAIVFAVIINIVVLFRNSPKFVTVSDHKNRIVSRQKILIQNQKGEIIDKAETSRLGKLRIIATPGFFQLKKHDSIGKIFEVKSQKPLGLKIKLN